MTLIKSHLLLRVTEVNHSVHCFRGQSSHEQCVLEPKRERQISELQLLQVITIYGRYCMEEGGSEVVSRDKEGALEALLV